MNKTVLCLTVLIAMGASGAVCCADDPIQERLRQLEKQVVKREIAEGSFQRLTVGDSKKTTVAELRNMGVQFVRPGPLDPPQVRKSEDLESLRDAEGVMISAGGVFIWFKGDRVDEVFVAPFYSEWDSLLKDAKTRDQVFDSVTKILDNNPGTLVRGMARDIHHVTLDRMTVEDTALLQKYDSWEASYDNTDGYWTLRLAFHDDHLVNINVWHSPVALP